MRQLHHTSSIRFIHSGRREDETMSYDGGFLMQRGGNILERLFSVRREKKIQRYAFEPEAANWTM